MHDHTKLRAFELADEVAVSIYRVTARFPKSELYGLTAQIRRVAVSVPSDQLKKEKEIRPKWFGRNKIWVSDFASA